MANPAPRNPYDGAPPARTTGRHRPVTVIAFIAHALVVGPAMAGGSAFGIYQSWAWMDAAPPGHNRVFGAVLGYMFCTLGVLMGILVLRSGIRMLSGKPKTDLWAAHTYNTLFGFSCLLVVNMVFTWDPDSDGWLVMAQAAAVAFVVLLSGVLLGNAKPTSNYFARPRPPRPPARRPVR
ncbi:hypothetical protein DVA86_22930 [Streptomyces armeniacus]|uniref:DUF2231 domain-containing protein n=1 Tax=Streptomyces armeniacus TaxID=83291 RepID=A0A345XTV9_9ACTN|nr:hypothetical protein [Streptomyces armeniacus]AXK35075.1 hypothetical protein DVA86_22930 [Streptomyces armeniacus]